MVGIVVGDLLLLRLVVCGGCRLCVDLSWADLVGIIDFAAWLGLVLFAGLD